MEYYKGKIAIVTGASSGIGREISRELIRHGSTVIAASRRQDALDSLSIETKDLAGKCIPLPTDIQSDQGQERLLNTAIGQSGQIDFLINNAGVGHMGELAESKPEQMRQSIETNLTASIMLTRRVCKKMIEQEGGHIAFVTSLAGKMGFPGLSVYSASKFGLEGFADAIRQELEPKNIPVTVLRPGVTDTEFFEVAGMESFANNMRKQGSIYSPEFVASKFIKGLPKKPHDINIGDSLFIKLLPYIPAKYRFKILSLLS